MAGANGLISPPTAEIPIVDFAAWKPTSTQSQREKIAAQLADACKRVGFVYIINHGISSQKLAEVFDWMRLLFSLPDEKKMLAPHPPGFTVHRGYSWPGLEKVSNSMGDEEDADDLAKKLREVPDVKVSPARSL